MTDNFDRAMEFTLKYEGGYVNHPADPGGETKYGISKRAYPDVNIKELTIEQAKAIYKRDYWDKAGCDKRDWPLCLAVFDTAVNCGVGRALKFFATTCNLQEYLNLRRDFYRGLNKPMFLKGWLRRVDALEKFARECEEENNT